jgi:diguanylate cyclase (GGDEF)-like protein
MSQLKPKNNPLGPEAIARQIGIQSIIASLILSGIAGYLGIGTDLHRTIPVSDAWVLHLSTAFLVPLLLAPVLVWRLATQLSKLSADNVELDAKATCDPLTGTLNRRGFEAQAARVLERAGQTGAPVTLMLCDLDHFKAVNDTYGHEAGDAAIQHFASVLEDTLGQLQATIARIGGEEFVILLPDIPPAHIESFGELVRLTIERQPVITPTEQFQITVSIGMVCQQGQRFELGALLKSADKALYAAKRNGRNRVRVSDEHASQPKQAWPADGDGRFLDEPPSNRDATAVSF